MYVAQSYAKWQTQNQKFVCYHYLSNSRVIHYKPTSWASSAQSLDMKQGGLLPSGERLPINPDAYDAFVKTTLNTCHDIGHN